MIPIEILVMTSAAIGAIMIVLAARPGGPRPRLPGIAAGAGRRPSSQSGR
ncbi:hypothetical protein OPKNFCMD_0036 [Methylobacterium crusticola]|uniref:Uncharacterized protein n=1 Tax=Methylobacterium crusticola TaxID=1697972 RepID=A0ABQ4QQZ7_9HYPH|nr:hypothetical protein [Methylobacterium crusticola]GJD47330.1 hypothetical protein OPKNFCMD_0036 [Methylobacterium crusticola]